MCSDPLGCVMDAKETALQMKIAVAVADKQLDVLRSEGFAIAKLLEPPSSPKNISHGKGAQLDLSG